jgi:hypothetical protein
MANNKPIGVAYADPLLDSVQVGTSNAPIEINTSGVLNGAYATTSATSGDTRLNFSRLTFTSTGSGETARILTRVTGANGATAGTINGAHISMSVNSGGSISGAGNALRATLGVATGVTPGGTLASIQVDSDFPSTVTLPGSAAFLRFTNSNSGTIDNLMNLPVAMVPAEVGAVLSHTIKVVASDGTPYYLMVSDQP